MLNKRDTVKFLWEAVEVLQKTVRGLYENPTCMGTDMWTSLQDILSDLKSVRFKTIGAFYYIETYEKEKPIVRLEGFEPRGPGGVRAFVRVLSSPTIRISYVDVKDEMEISAGNIGEEVPAGDLTKDKLLLLMGHTFKGTLLEEMMK
jgi:hypothetical protein